MDLTLPLRFSHQRQQKIFLEKLELLETDDNQGGNQFVFQLRQCMVLGDSGTGKTSLVKSLMGEEFDPGQTKTKGIDVSLVDKKWKNHNMKELVFGDLWRFFRFGLVKVLLIATGTATSNVIVQNFIVWKRGFPFTLCVWLIMAITMLVMKTIYDTPVGLVLFLFIYHIPDFASFCFFYFDHNQSRFMLATLSFILRRRGLLIGFYLAPVICLWDETFAAKFISIIGFVAAVIAITLLGLFLLIGPISMSFGNNRQEYSYPVQFIHHKLPIATVCFFRLLLSTTIGLTFGFAAVSHVSVSLKDSYKGETFKTYPNVKQIVRFFVTGFVCLFPAECLKHSFLFRILDRSWGPLYKLLFIWLIFDPFKLVLTSQSFYLYYFVLFPLFVCYTFYVELFHYYLTLPGNFECPNKLITLVVGKAAMDNRLLKSALNEKFSSPKLKILDFAGDKDYYAYHHMFLRSHAIYIIVFNMAEFVENDFRGTSTGIQRLQFWFESVCSHVPLETPILLVGTHRGNMNKDHINILNGHLKGNLWNPYCDELVTNDVEGLVFFPVENSDGQNDFGVQHLQKKIMAVAEKCKETIGHEIPLSWVRIQDAIISLKEKKNAKFCVTLEEFPRAFENLVCTDWSKETLKYFHEQGLVIYLDRKQDLNLSNWVLLKPEILMDIIIQLVTPPPEITQLQERGLRRHWNLLQKKGMLTKSLLRTITSKVQENEAAITAFLEECDLICPLANKKLKKHSLHEEDELPTHFVPSLLPLSAERDTPTWHDDNTDKKFFVFFNRFLPEPLWYRLLSRAHKLSKLEFPNGQTVLFRDAGRFWMSAWQPYCLKLIKEEKMIEVTLTCR